MWGLGWVSSVSINISMGITTIIYAGGFSSTPQIVCMESLSNYYDNHLRS